MAQLSEMLPPVPPVLPAREQPRTEQRQTEQQRQGYDGLKNHYRVEPITVRSRQLEKVASLPQLQAFVRRYSLLRSTIGKNL